MIIMCVNLHLGDDELDWFQNKNMIGLKTCLAHGHLMDCHVP